MPEFRLTQISDTHLARRLSSLTDNFHRLSEYIDTRRPDLVVNSGDNPTAVGPAPPQLATEQGRQAFIAAFGEDRWRFEAAGWCFIGLNSLVMNTGLASEAEQFDWLAAQLAATGGKPVALFLHKPLFLHAPGDPELAASAIRYVPMPARSRLLEMLGSVDLRLVASGHVHQRRDFTHSRVRHLWAPSAGFVISDKRQEVIGIKEV
ncbi:MAG: metallophosphoesterase family protein, partial [Xanthobacteraceae bacterium]